MSKLITNTLRLFNVDNFVESFTEPNFNLYYMFVGRPVSFPDDNHPPVLYDNNETVNFDAYNNMIYGKRVEHTDVARMITRYEWATGTVFDKYSHDDTNIFESNFYTVVNDGSQYSVFKCLDNNNGAPSTTAPSFLATSPSDDFYFTADGYQWKYMYPITPVQYNKFTTPGFIPVYSDANVVANAINGSIDNVQVLNGGNNYIAYASGILQEVGTRGNPLAYSIDPANASTNTNFYNESALKIVAGIGAGQQRKITGYTIVGSQRIVVVENAFEIEPTDASSYEISPLITISGDGTGALARAIVNSVSNTVYSIEITERGSGYTFASASISGNTGVIGEDGGAVCKVIISPVGGHGSDPAEELGCKYVCMSSTFDSNLADGKIIDENDFRVVGLLRDPVFNKVVLSISNTSGLFSPGERLSQSTGSPVAGIVIVNPGSGYRSNASIVITGTSVTEANAYGVSNSTGRISSVVLSNSGLGYLTANVQISAPQEISFNGNTGVSNTNDFVSISNNVFQNNDIITYYTSAGNTAISGLSNNGTYYIVSANSTGVKLSSTINGSAINLTAGVTESGHYVVGTTATAVIVLDTDKDLRAYGTVEVANTSQVTLSNVHGIFTSSNGSYALLYGNSSGYTARITSADQPDTYFDQTLTLSGGLQTVETFLEDELVTQDPNGNAYVYFANSSVVKLINKKGTVVKTSGGINRYINGNTSLARFLISDSTEPDLIKNSGDVIYIENFSPITKTTDQTETFRLILEF